MAVVGGGAVGVCCALELARRGARVTLYERGPTVASGCSAGNAGLICPSHSTPIANPASLRNGLRWMWKRDSPFYLRPRPAVLPWLARFALASRHPEEGAAAIRELSLASLELHAELGEELGTSFERTGTLNVYETNEGLEAEARAAARSGLSFEVFDADGTRELEPALVGPAVGSVRYPREGRVDPRRFVEAVASAAAAAGADIRTDTEIGALDQLDAETVVVAAGAWSKRLVKLPLEGGKGYHVDYERSEDTPRMPGVGTGDVDDRDAAAGSTAVVGDARARRARPLRLRAAGRQDPCGRRALVPRPAQQPRAGDVGRAEAVPPRWPARDRPAERSGGRNRSRNEGGVARAGHGTAGRAAARGRVARPRSGALPAGPVLEFAR